MRLRSTLIGTLLAGTAGVACGDTVVVQRLGSSGETSAASGSGATSGSSGVGGGEPATSGAGAATPSTSGAGASTPSSGAGGSPSVCPHVSDQVFGCVLGPGGPLAFGEDATVDVIGRVVAVGEPAEGCFANDNDARHLPFWSEPALLGGITWATIELSGGATYQVGLSLPGLADDVLAEGDEVHLTFMADDEGFEFAPAAALRLTRDGQLVAAVGDSVTPEGIELKQGEQTCYEEDQICGRATHAMVVGVGDELAEIGEGQTANVGGLMVTNARFFELYDKGACNFGRAVNYVVGAAAP